MPSPEYRPRPDVRRRALITTLIAIALLGSVIALSPSTPGIQPPPALAFADVLKLDARPQVLSSADQQRLNLRFEQGVTMLHARQFEFALAAFHEVLSLAPALPEAHVNMGFTLLGLEQWKAASDFFSSAIDLRRDQLNAYYGLALALGSLGDTPGAIGAMQSYLHRSPATDPYRSAGETALAQWRNLERDSRARSDTPPATGASLQNPQ